MSRRIRYSQKVRKLLTGYNLDIETGRAQLIDIVSAILPYMVRLPPTYRPLIGVDNRRIFVCLFALDGNQKNRPAIGLEHTTKLTHRLFIIMTGTARLDLKELHSGGPNSQMTIRDTVPSLEEHTILEESSGVPVVPELSAGEPESV